MRLRDKKSLHGWHWVLRHHVFLALTGQFLLFSGSVFGGRVYSWQVPHWKSPYWTSWDPGDTFHWLAILELAPGPCQPMV
jgi:hypothetical protein